MLSRRFLRIKAFQALYSYFQSEDKSMKKLESETFLSLERMHDLYLFFLTIGQELTHLSELKIEEARNKNAKRNIFGKTEEDNGEHSCQNLLKLSQNGAKMTFKAALGALGPGRAPGEQK